jgi:hypothetical protein
MRHAVIIWVIFIFIGNDGSELVFLNIKQKNIQVTNFFFILLNLSYKTYNDLFFMS